MVFLFNGYQGSKLAAMFSDRGDAERWVDQGVGRFVTVDDYRAIEVEVERERMIYWLLRAWASDCFSLKDLSNFLEQLGYAPGSERAERMLELGEPGS